MSPLISARQREQYLRERREQILDAAIQVFERKRFVGATVEDIREARLIIVSADLNTGEPVLHGTTLDEEVLEELLVSMALPLWVMPARKRDRYLIDGGVVSNLPIEPARRAGATEIVALDLMDPRELLAEQRGIGFFLDRLTFAVEKRQADLEMELAEARGISVLYLELSGRQLIPFWDFHHTDDIIEQGYEIALRALGKHSDRLIETIQV